MTLPQPVPGQLLIVGHRGAEAVAPENTWPSFQIGYEAGADLLEVDVQLTRDGEAVVFHDFTLWPKLRDPRWVRDLAWADLRHLDIGCWFGSSFAGEHIPLFTDLLDWARGRVPLQVDLKHGFVEPEDDRLEMAALDLIERAGMVDQVVISSWDQVALQRIRAREPGVALAVNLRARVPDPVAHVSPTGARWVVVYWPQVDRYTVDRLKESGRTVLLTDLFTADYAEALRLGVDAITASDPGAVRAALPGHDPATESGP